MLKVLHDISRDIMAAGGDTIKDTIAVEGDTIRNVLITKIPCLGS